MKCPDFELLSAYADQELTPIELGQVEAHLPGCQSCRARLGDLQRVGRQIARPAPSGLALQLRPRARPGWWQRLRQLADSPVVHLVSTQRRRRARFGPSEMLKMAGFFALPIPFMCISPDRSSLTAYLLFSALGLMLGLPLRQFGEEVALLASLRRGRCLEEIVSTGTSAQALLDGLALQGLMQLGRASLTVWPVLLLGTLGLPDYWQLTAWKLELLWPPALAAFFLAGYYFAQFLQVWPGGGVRRLMIAVALLCPGLLLGPLAGTLVSALAARKLAIYGLNNPVRNRTVPVHRRNALVRSFSQNPIARRELSRLAGQVGGDWRRLMFWRASMMVLPVAWCLHAARAEFRNWPDVYAAGLLMFSALFFVRSGMRTLPAVVREREQQSWEILLQTHLSKRSFVSGWLQVCLYTVFTEGFLAILALASYLLALIPSPSQPGAAPWLLLLPATCLLGAYVGLAISASSRNARQASQRLMLWSLSGLCAWLVSLGLFRGLFHNPAPFYGVYEPTLGPLSLAACLPGALLLAARARADLRLLTSVDPDEMLEEQPLTRYNPAMLCLDLASLVILFDCLKLWDRLNGALNLSTTSGTGLLFAGALIWWLLVRMPVASLCEAALGGLINVPIGIFSGMALGECLKFTLHYNYLDVPWLSPEILPPTALACSVALGAILGIRAAASPPIADARIQTLIGRLRWSIVTVLAAAAALVGLACVKMPPSPVLAPLPLTSRYELQLSQLQDGLLDFNRCGLDTSRVVDPESRLPEFGSAREPARLKRAAYLERSLTVLNQLALDQERRSDWRRAVNTLRWCLLCLDTDESLGSQEILQSETLEKLHACLIRSPLQPDTGRELIDQLLDQTPVQQRLRGLCQVYLSLWVQQLEPTPLPQAYKDWEQRALALALARAEQSIRALDLWKLAYQAEPKLLAGVSLCPVTRCQLSDPQFKEALRASLRLATRREGLALVVAIKLYRQQHPGSWPENLEQLNPLLPRPARCYTNQQGTFDYRPGYLGARDDSGGLINLLSDADLK
ncbi:MAG: zf-HC2 domain-containing protein [Vulcanimicrobiota bacterium]